MRRRVPVDGSFCERNVSYLCVLDVLRRVIVLSPWRKQDFRD